MVGKRRLDIKEVAITVGCQRTLSLGAKTQNVPEEYTVCMVRKKKQSKHGTEGQVIVMRLMIEVDDAIEVVQDVVSLPLYMFSSLCDMLEANAVDAQPVVHGHWIEGAENFSCGNRNAECSNCGNMISWNGCDEDWNYCPNCGAKMGQEVDDGKVD